MKAEDIIEGLNLFLEKERELKGINIKGHFVLNKITEIPSTFTSTIKRVTATVWYVSGKSSVTIIKESIQDKMTSESDEIKINRLLNVKTSTAIFKLITSHTWSKIVEGDIKYDTSK